MTGKRKQIVYSALLIVPSVVTAAIAFYLLSNEQARLKEASKQATTERAELIAQTISIAVSESKSGIMESLAKLPEESIIEELEIWQSGSPFIRSAIATKTNGQIESAVGDLLDPPPLITDGKVVWDLPPEQISKEHPMAGVINMKQKAAWQAKIEVLERMQPRYGWWSAIDENHGLRLAAWYRPNADSRVRAVEVDVDRLTEDLEQFLPGKGSNPHTFTLADSSGEVIHSSGDSSTSTGEAIDVEIGSELPGWTLVAIHHWKAEKGSNLLIVGFIVILLLVATAIIAGVVLIRQSGRDARIATQKSTFVSNVSHELKTPLTSIRMSAEILETGRIKDAAGMTKHLRTIVSESERLNRLVNNVLDFSRLEHGNRKFDTANHNITSIVEAALESRQVALESVGMTIERDYDPEQEVTASVDQVALEAILLNLVENAIKYASAGKLLRVKIDDSNSPRIIVADNGPGVKSSQRNAIFDRFHRVEDSLTDQSGTGLGLSIARMLARGMEGDLNYLEKFSNGAAFEITLNKPN